MVSNLCRTTLGVALCAALAAPAFAQDYELNWWTIDGGGEMFTAGGVYEVSGTVGQHDAGPLSGGLYELVGGFWPVATVINHGDLNCDGLINGFDVDPFIVALIYPDDYEDLYPGCPLGNADLNCDGEVNGFDVDYFLNCLLFNDCDCP